MPRLLLTRPRAQSEAFAAEVKAKTALIPLLSPMQDMQDLTAEIDLTGIEALAFTSQNGVRAFARMSSCRLPAYCVGSATAAVAKALGFRVHVAPGSAEALAATLPETGVLHLHGQEVRRVVGQRHLAIYRQVAKPLSATAKAGLAAGDIEAAAVFSPRSALLLAKELALIPAPLPVFYALSAAVAQALPKTAEVKTCPAPAAAAMLRLLSADFPA